MGATGHKPPRGVREMPDVVEPRQIDFTHVGVNEVDVLKVRGLYVCVCGCGCVCVCVCGRGGYFICLRDCPPAS
jgi:hypothetical protein